MAAADGWLIAGRRQSHGTGIMAAVTGTMRPSVGAIDDPNNAVFQGDLVEGTQLVRLRQGRVLKMISAGEIMEMQAVAAILLSELKRVGRRPANMA
jgi:hypothetical protein